MEPVGDSALGGEVDHLVHHVARACHYEAHVVVVFQHLRGGLDEVFRAFLHGDAAQEGDNLVFGLLHLDVEEFLAQGGDGVVDGGHLGGVDAVFVYHRLAGEV